MVQTFTNLAQAKAGIYYENESVVVIGDEGQAFITEQGYDSQIEVTYDTHFRFTLDGIVHHCFLKFDHIGDWTYDTGNISPLEECLEWKGWSKVFDDEPEALRAIKKHIEANIIEHNKNKEKKPESYWYKKSSVNMVLAWEVSISVSQDWETGCTETDMEESFLGIVDVAKWTKETFVVKT